MMVDDDEDYSEIRMRAALPLGRFPPENKHKFFQEKLVVSDALKELNLDGFELVKGDDPPDICIKVEGQNIGIEVVELVDQDALHARIKVSKGRNLNHTEKRNLLRGEDIGREEFLAMLKEQISAKDISVLGFSKYWLAIHTVEPNFYKSNVDQWLLNMEFETKHIDRVILKLDYEPGTNSNPCRHPVFDLKIKKPLVKF